MNKLRSRLGRVGVASAALSAAGAALLGFAGAASAGTVSGTNGTMTIVQTDGKTALNNGGSGTIFEIALSASPGKTAADCSADSATGSTTTYSYMVQQSVDPTTINFTDGFPNGSSNFGTTTFGLFSSGNYWGGVNTASGTGQVMSTAVQFQFNPPLDNTYTSALLYNGPSSPATYNIGVACWNEATSKITDEWNELITLSPSAGDAAGYTWTASNPVQQNVPEVPLPIVLPLGAAVLMGGGVMFARRRRTVSGSTAS